MYLKRLSIHGFKSFANRTTFEFKPGVTAVVGPNGSGKSNVADAIRWVLGEQSSRLLRARKQEDVIFAGTGKRSAVGMAEVLLTLDNEDKWLPVDFAEVEIGRRVYRNGDSEYLLNGSRVRLKDLVDLLARGDVGQNSYTIMGQGLVDQVLTMSPQERRTFLDEAAEVKRFRSRIEEAYNRLASTRENMERVHLVISEIEPRLSQLQRQADRAAEHRELAARLVTLLREYYTHAWGDAQNAIVRARASLDQRIAEDAAAQERVVTIREQIHALSDEIRKRREAIGRRDTRQSDFEQKLAVLERDIALDRERHGMLLAREEELQVEIAAVQAEKDALASTDLDDGRRGAEVTGELEEARTLVATSREALDQVEREHSALRGRVQDLRSARESDERRMGELLREAEQADRRASEATREAAQVEAKRKQLLVDLIGYGRRFKELQDTVADADDRLDASRHESEQARERLSRVQQELRGYEDAVNADLRQQAHLEGRLDALRRVQAESDGIATGTRNVLIMGQALLDDVRPGTLGEAPEISGIVGLLSRQIRVPAGLERAINAALEQRLHAVIVNQERDAHTAIELLRQRRNGRAQFIALDSLQQVYPLNLQKEKGVVGVASRLVRCEANFRQLVDTLLGRVIVVEDAETATRMSKRGLGSIVTLDGTLVEPNGIISGGASSDEEGVFTRQRELDELPEQIAEIRGRTQAGRERVEQARHSLEQLSRRAGETEGNYDALRRELDAARDALDRERERLHRSRRDMDAIRGRIGESARQHDEAIRRAIQARDVAEELRSRIDEQAQALTAAEEGLAGAELARNAALDAVSTASGQLATIEGERRTLEVMREQHERAVERLATQLAARQQQATNFQAEAKLIAERLEKLAGDLEALRRQEAASLEDAAPDRDELARLESHERAVQLEFEEAQSTLLRVQRERLDLEAALARAEERAANIRLEMEREGLAPDAQGAIVRLEEARQQADGEDAEHPAIRGGAIVDLDALRKEIEVLRARIRRLGPINEEAPEDYHEVQERYEFLTTQARDLTDAEVQLREAITELNQEIKVRFSATYERVNAAFGEYFTAFFGGGKAELQLVDPDDIASSGIEIVAQPAGKRINTLSMLSGGERALTAVALLFALLSVNPAPFCVLDEVDAALDEANVGRFKDSLRKLSERTQFLVVTHNRNTIEATDAIYGVSMGQDGVSKTLSLRLDDLLKK